MLSASLSLGGNEYTYGSGKENGWNYIMSSTETRLDDNTKEGFYDKMSINPVYAAVAVLVCMTGTEAIGVGAEGAVAIKEALARIAMRTSTAGGI